MDIIDAPQDINSIKSEFDLLLTKLDEETNKRVESEKLSALYNQARQVAHDIRSPLLVLDMAIQSINIPDKQRSLIINAAQRISGIADDLLNKNRNTNKQELSSHNISTMLQEIISEKKIELNSSKLIIDYNHENNDQPIPSKIHPTEFKRIISNLINNAAEAINHDDGVIRTKLARREYTAFLEISDNGCGIPPEVLQTLSSGNAQHLSHNKVNGNGLGVYHAIASVQSWFGSISFQSEVGSGTTVTISLPISE